MRFPFTRRDDTVGPGPRKIDRRTVVTLVLGLAAIITAITVASNTGSSKRDGSTVPESVMPGYLGQVPGGGLAHLPPISAAPAEQVVSPGEWADAMEPVAGARPENEPRRAKYTAATESGGIIYKAAPDKESEGAGGAAGAALAAPERTLVAGTMIEAVLESAIDSDRPGPVAARVLADVRDSHEMTNVLVPAGTRVLGQVSQGASAASPAVRIAWNRLMFPDGRSQDIASLPSMDRTGAPGLAGNVDRHRTARYSRTVLQTVLGLGQIYGMAQLAEGSGALGQTAALRYGLGGAGSGTVRQLGRPPTVRVPAGEVFVIFVEQDLTL